MNNTNMRQIYRTCNLSYDKIIVDGGFSVGNIF